MAEREKAVATPADGVMFDSRERIGRSLVWNSANSSR
jgi:hypothetical protein